MPAKPTKGLGQNFLIDRNIQKKIIQASNLTVNDTVLEIGAGRGELTACLLARAKKVIAVEIDKELCGILENRFRLADNFRLLNEDILKVNIRAIADEETGKDDSLKVIANLPYYIATAIISHLINCREKIVDIFLTLQKELGKRLIARPPEKAYSAFSCFVQFYTNPKILFTIKNTSFWPKPRVDSCFIRLEVRQKPSVMVRDERLFFKIIRTAFSQRRKFLKNSLKPVIAPLEVWENKLDEAGLNLNLRPEALNLLEFAKLTNIIYNKETRNLRTD